MVRRSSAAGPCSWDGDSPERRLATATELQGLRSPSLLMARTASDGKYILMATTDTALGNSRLTRQVNQ